jgi:hypothetical protein
MGQKMLFSQGQQDKEGRSFLLVSVSAFAFFKCLRNQVLDTIP